MDDEALLRAEIFVQSNMGSMQTKRDHLDEREDVMNQSANLEPIQLISGGLHGYPLSSSGGHKWVGYAKSLRMAHSPEN